jgi:alkylation response protein AidB-like acyl-CoA dehydrogenase
VRATASHDTVFDNALAEAHKTVARYPVGPVYPDYVGMIFAWYLPLLSSVYFGIARRALDLAILGAQTRNSLREGISRHAQKPAVQRQIAQAEIKLEAVFALVDSVSHPEPGDWSPLRALAARIATTTAREAVEIAVQVVGAASVSKRHELNGSTATCAPDRCTRPTRTPSSRSSAPWR